jgi:hypothetical protein
MVISRDFGLNWSVISTLPTSSIVGEIRSVLVDSTGNNIIVSRYDLTLLKSVNQGVSFLPVSNDINRRWDVSNGNNDLSVVIVGSIENEVQSNFYLYTNNTWKTLPTGKITQSIACDEVGNTLMYCGINDNLYISVNGGNTWNTNTVSEGLWTHCLCNFDGSALYAGCVLSGVDRNLSRVYRSRDKGFSWDIIFETDMYLLSLTADRSGSRIVATFDQTYEYIYVSKDYGINWASISKSFVSKSNSTNKWSPTVINSTGDKILSFNLVLTAPEIGRIFSIA